LDDISGIRPSKNGPREGVHCHPPAETIQEKYGKDSTRMGNGTSTFDDTLNQPKTEPIKSHPNPLFGLFHTLFWPGLLRGFATPPPATFISVGPLENKTLPMPRKKTKTLKACPLLPWTSKVF